MPDVQADAASENVSKTSKKRKTWPVIMVALGVLGASGMVGWLRSDSSSGAAEQTIALETFVVNLGSTQRAYLRVGVSLGLTRALPRKQADAFPTALVRDTILSVLSKAEPEELLKSEGKRELKDEILKALQQRAPQLGIENVYFTEFLVQM